jgi:hypothetical protein
MLTPKAAEITRGYAPPTGTGPVKAVPAHASVTEYEHMELRHLNPSGLSLAR